MIHGVNRAFHKKDYTPHAMQSRHNNCLFSITHHKYNSIGCNFAEFFAYVCIFDNDKINKKPANVCHSFCVLT